MKKVLVTGILGQDGANMAEYLLGNEEEVEVYGMMRRTSNANFGNIKPFRDHPRFNLVCGDLTDEVSIDKLVKEKLSGDSFPEVSVSESIDILSEVPP